MKRAAATRPPEAEWVPLTPGRPRKGVNTGTPRPRTIRLPDSVWTKLQARAEQRGLKAHALVRELIAEYLARDA